MKKICGGADVPFLVTKTGNDISCTRTKDTQCSAPEYELSLGTVHVAGLALQALFVTNEQMTFESQFLTSSSFSRGSSSWMSPASPRLAQMSQTLGHTNPDAFHVFGPSLQIHVG